MRSVAIALLLGLTLSAASAFASPIVSVDGLFNASDVYWFSLADDTGEPGLAGGGLDISSVSFQEDDDYYYLGL